MSRATGALDKRAILKLRVAHANFRYLTVDFLVLTVVGTAFGAILFSEVTSWMPHLSRRLVRHVLDRLPDELPEDHRNRWREEIEADLESYADRPVAGLWFALGVRRRGARRLVAELVLQLVLSTPAREPRPSHGRTRAQVDAGGHYPTAYRAPRHSDFDDRTPSLRRQEIAELLGFEGVEEG